MQTALRRRSALVAPLRRTLRQPRRIGIALRAAWLGASTPVPLPTVLDWPPWPFSAGAPSTITGVPGQIVHREIAAARAAHPCRPPLAWLRLTVARARQRAPAPDLVHAEGG